MGRSDLRCKWSNSRPDIFEGSCLEHFSFEFTSKTIILLYLELQYLVERRDPFAKLVEGMRTASPFLQMQAYRAIMERSTSIVIKRLSRILEVNLALLSHAPSPQHRLM